MPRFITNIKLHDASEKDYLKLRTEMEKESFNRTTIQPEKNKTTTTNHPAEFNRVGKITLQDTTEAASRAASRTGKKYSFTIIKDKTLAD